MSFMTERCFQMLESHKLYDAISDEQSLRVFVENHVICVWTYNSLLRSIHRDLASKLQPFNCQKFKESAKIIGETILEEELEEQEDGSLLSHLEIYLEGMRDIGADMGPLLGFLDLLDTGMDWLDAMEQSSFATPARDYAKQIGKYFNSPLHERAAVLFYEGEPYIPDAFLIRLGQMELTHPISRLLDYFERHIEGLKRPGFSTIGRLVELLCGDDEQANSGAEQVAESVMRSRLDFWNAVHRLIEKNPQDSSRSSHSKLRLLPSAL